MNRLQYRDKILRERRRRQIEMKGGMAGTTLAGWATRSKVEQSFSTPAYGDTYTLNSPPTITRFFCFGYGEFGSTLGFSEE